VHLRGQKALLKPELERMKRGGLNRLCELSAERRTEEKLSKEEKDPNFLVDFRFMSDS